MGTERSCAYALGSLLVDCAQASAVHEQEWTNDRLRTTGWPNHGFGDGDEAGIHRSCEVDPANVIDEMQAAADAPAVQLQHHSLLKAVSAFGRRRRWPGRAIRKGANEEKILQTHYEVALQTVCGERTTAARIAGSKQRRV